MKKVKNHRMQSQETCWFISKHAEGSDLLFPSAWATAEAARWCPVLTIPVVHTSVQQWAPCQSAFNSSSHFLDRSDTKPVLQKTQRPWVSICYYNAWVLFPRWPGNTKWVHPPRLFHFQNPFFSKGRKPTNENKCQQSSEPPCHLRTKSCKIPIFSVKGWVLLCFAKLFSDSWDSLSSMQSFFPYREKGDILYWGLLTLVQKFFF